MFDLHGNERLTEWKRFRDSLESSETPFEDTVNFWSRAPFVNPYLNPNRPETWPDPWHLVLDLKLDNLAISLSMLYTLKLTQRFMNSRFEIHSSMSGDEKSPNFILAVDNERLLDHLTRQVLPYDYLRSLNASKVWEYQ